MTALHWLAATCLMTALFWVPYVLNRMAVRGIAGAMANPAATDKPHAPWAQRMQKAHTNAIENLTVFAPLVIVAQILGVDAGLLATSALVYFLARLVHVVVYAAGIPVVRTLAFATGWAAQIVVALAAFGLVG